MSLFLTGGGEQEVFRSLDKLFFEKLPKEAVVGILAQAVDVPEESLDRIEQDFSHKNIKKHELIEVPDESVLEYDALMIEGGNTFQLIRAIRDSAFFDLIKEFANKGKPIYADSAGAIMLGSDVHTAFLGDEGDEDSQKLQDYRGLDIIHPWCLHAHATVDDLDDLQDLLYATGNPVLALPENTGLRFFHNELEVFGEDPLWVVTFMGTDVIKPGEKRLISDLF